jgi:hypothetical protein
MFKNDRYAVHSIVETIQLGFSPVDYSKFKYGDISIAQKFGNELFDYFLRDILNSNHALPQSFTVYSSPYFFLPTSSLHMTKAFYDRFVGFAKEHHELIYNIKIGKIDRCHSYTSDYGAMTAEERFELIKNDTYKFNELPDSKSTLLFLDDISSLYHYMKIHSYLKLEMKRDYSLDQLKSLIHFEDVDKRLLVHY